MGERNPGKLILLIKFDADSAFQRLGLLRHSMLKTIIIHKHRALMSKRTAFGGNPPRTVRGAVAEIMINLDNEAVNNGGLKELSERATNYEDHYMVPERLDAGIPMTGISGLIFKPHMAEKRLVNVYVDGNFLACLDEKRGACTRQNTCTTRC